jgi:putative hemolysin
VTLTDILEELVGNTMPVGEGELADVVRLDEDRWNVSGSVHIDDVLKLLDLPDDTLPAEPGYHTLGGFMAERLGRVPQDGDESLWGGFRFRVVAMDGLRVDTVEIQRPPEEELPAAAEEDGARPID